MTKNARTEEFARRLQTATERQGLEFLHSIVAVDGRIEHAYCCLGIGTRFCAGIEPTVVPDVTMVEAKRDLDGAIHLGHAIYPEPAAGESGVMENLPPLAFYQWLELPDVEDAVPGASVFLDAAEYPLRAPERVRLLPTLAQPLEALNDVYKLTLSQIGDLVAYFGLTMHDLDREASRRVSW